MAEVRDLAAGEKALTDQDHVLIERTSNGKYSAIGSVASNTVGTFWTPPPFKTEGEAISAAQSWASESGVPVILVRRGVD